MNPNVQTHIPLLDRIVILLGVVSASTFLGCGKQSFDVVKSQKIVDSPGILSIEPEIDLLVGIDNSGSMSGTTNQTTLNQNLRSFMSSLSTQGWNYRLTSVPLVPTGADTNLTAAIANIPLTAIAASNQKLSPVDPALYVSPSAYNGFPVATSSSSFEPGISVIAEIANRSDYQSKFIRPTAKLVSIVISNGDDVSEPIDTTVFPPAAPSTVSSSLIDRLKQAKATHQDPDVRAYSIVNTTGASCFGLSGASRRYINFATQFLGQSFHLCNGASAADSALRLISAQLETIRLDYKIGAVFLTQEPNPDTIRVFRLKAGGSEEELPKFDGTNGWEYVGFGSYYQIVAPTNQAFGTGFTILLKGSSQISGNESARVEYLPKGVQPSTGG